MSTCLTHSSFLSQAWFGNRRRKWKKEQKKGIVGPSGIRPVLPRSSLIQPSYQRSFQNTVGFSRSTEIPFVPLQWFPSSLQSVQAPLESPSNPIMRAAAAGTCTVTVPTVLSSVPCSSTYDYSAVSRNQLCGDIRLPRTRFIALRPREIPLPRRLKLSGPAPFCRSQVSCGRVSVFLFHRKGTAAYLWKCG